MTETEDVRLVVTVKDGRGGCTAEDWALVRVLPGPSAPNLTIKATASRDLVTPGSAFNYTLLFNNSGGRAATNVTVTCDLDSNLDLEASTPPPDAIRGRVYIWRCGTLCPGQSGSISIMVRAKGSIGHPHPRAFVNRYRIDSDEFEGAFMKVETFCVNSLWINKSADREVCNPGEVVTYNIFYGNSEEIPAEDVVVIDGLPDVEFIESQPPPDGLEGGVLQWVVGSMRALENGSITIKVRIRERPEVHFGEFSSVQGEGFVSTRRRIGAVGEGLDFVNRANITGRYWSRDRTQWTESRDSDHATVSLSSPMGSSLKSEAHGSGSFCSGGRYTLDERNGSISMSRSASMDQRTVSLSMPRGREVEIDSLWRDCTDAKSLGGKEEIVEDLRYARSASTNVSWQADENQSVYRSEIEFFGGRDLMSYAISAEDGMDAGVDIDQEFDGSFVIQRSVDSYKGDIRYLGFSTGTGFVTSDRGIGGRIEARETGSGSYSSADALDGRSIYSGSRMDYQPYDYSLGSLHLNRSSMWDESIESKDTGNGLMIRETIDRAGYIENDVMADGSSLSSFGSFEGDFELLASKKSQSGGQVIDLAQRFAGRYEMGLAVSIRGAPRYLGPHVNITKKAAVRDEDYMTFDIWVTNDGNRTLGPIYVTDTLPAGMTFINSSVRPEVSGGRVMWTLSSMAPGARELITMAARLEGGEAGLSNVAVVEAVFPGGSVTARASCLVPSDALPCCIARAVILENQSAEEMPEEDLFSCFEAIDEGDGEEMCGICH